MGQHRDRAFTGCWKCRERKIKCDETTPSCLACDRLGVQCTGYAVKYVWVGTGGHVSRSDGRRLLSCESTWKGYKVLPMDVVDLLISQCDADSSPDCGVSCSKQLPLRPEFHNPFSVFPAIDLSSDSHSDGAVRAERGRGLGRPSTEESIADNVPRTLAATTNTSQQEHFLFQHYLNHISGLMVPYEHPNNPWKYLFPAAALSPTSTDGKTLYHTMLAHAAFNIAHLCNGDSVMYDVGSMYYDLAIAQLLSDLGGGVRSSPATLASIISLMYAEVYRGSSQDWTHHYHGAWGMIIQYSESMYQNLDDLSSASVKSLSIAKIIGDTSRTAWPGGQVVSIAGDAQAERAMQASVFTQPHFGLTIGADREIMECISRITDFRNDRDRGAPVQDTDEFIANILAILNRYRRKLELQSRISDGPGNEQDCMYQENYAEYLYSSGAPPGAASQKAAFVFAAYIYLYRTVLDVPPHAVRSYVSETFAQVSMFVASSSGNFSLWPAFVAAAEAYTDEDMIVSRNWLEGAVSFGLGSRYSAKRVLEEIWRWRGEIARQTGLDEGCIIVNWRTVMQTLDTDVLLI